MHSISLRSYTPSSMSLPVRLCQQVFISANRIHPVSLQFFSFLSPSRNAIISEESTEKPKKFPFSQPGDEGRGRHMCHHFGREALSSFGCHLPPIKKKRKKLIIETFPRQHNSMGITYPAHDHQLLERACQHQFYSEKTKKKTKRKQKKGSTSKYMAVLGLRAPPCW